MGTLLTVVRGPISFDNLQSIEGVTYSIYQQVCIARVLLKNDVGMEIMPSKSLWEEFMGFTCDNLKHCLQCMTLTDQSPVKVYDYCLYLFGQRAT